MKNINTNSTLEILKISLYTNIQNCKKESEILQIALLRLDAIGEKTFASELKVKSDVVDIDKEIGYKYNQSANKTVQNDIETIVKDSVTGMKILNDRGNNTYASKVAFEKNAKKALENFFDHLDRKKINYPEDLKRKQLYRISQMNVKKPKPKL